MTDLMEMRRVIWIARVARVGILCARLLRWMRLESTSMALALAAERLILRAVNRATAIIGKQTIAIERVLSSGPLGDEWEIKAPEPGRTEWRTSRRIGWRGEA